MQLVTKLTAVFHNAKKMVKTRDTHFLTYLYLSQEDSVLDQNRLQLYLLIANDRSVIIRNGWDTNKNAMKRRKTRGTVIYIPCIHSLSKFNTAFQLFR